MTLYEKYRPRTFAEVIGQDSLVASVKLMYERGFLFGSPLLITGDSGTGKTTLARVIAEEYCDITFGIKEFNASDLSLEELRAEANFFNTCSWSGKPHCIIINEVHNLNSWCKQFLLVWLEKLGEKNNTLIIFTSILPGSARRETECLFENDRDGKALLSRCIELKIEKQGIAQKFAERAKEIAMREDLDGKPISVYLDRVNYHRGNFRHVLGDIQKGYFKQD
jgi:hypothetical protein